MSGILICASIVNNTISMPTREVIGMGRKIAEQTGDQVSVALLGADVSPFPQELIRSGADRVYVCENENLAEFHANIYLKALQDIVAKAEPSIVIFPAESAGMELAPRLAHRLKAGIVSDCIGCEVKDGAAVFTKPVYGSKAMAQLKVTSPVAIVTVRPRTQEALAEDPGRSGETIAVDSALAGIQPETTTIERVEEEVVECSLEDANIVVSGGRGLKDSESFEELRSLAKILNGAVGASRVAVDQALVPPTCQIGLTGKIVAPDVYFAFGISGASQHIAGMSGSKYIVAINSDPEAPIFSISNVGVVEDYRNVLPTIIEELRSRLNR